MKRILLRYGIFSLGITFMALGVTLTTKANLGTTPITALPYVASLGFAPSIGTFTVLLNLGLVAFQVCAMRKKFPRVQFLQIPVSFLFGALIDVWMHLVPSLAPGASYAAQLGYLGLGTVLLAFGVFVEVSADVVMMAGEGVVMVLSLVTHREFGLLKSAFDVSMVLMGVALSLAVFHNIVGIREGTLFSAVCVGLLVRQFFLLKARFCKKN